MTWTIYKYKLSFPLPKEAPQNLALIGKVVSGEKMFEIVDGRTPEHGYPISSPMSLRLRWAKIGGNLRKIRFFKIVQKTRSSSFGFVQELRSCR